MDAEQNKVASQTQREKIIVRTSIVGILTNIMLVIFKATIGIFVNSIAIILDAINNLSDVLSSVITIVGTKIAGKAPDKAHPFGHGRTEYITQMIIAAIILYAGIAALVESVKKMISPEAADYSAVSLIIVTASIFVKIILSTYVKRKGRQTNCGTLVASGTDAMFDAVISTSVLASALFYIGTGIGLEAYVGAVISLFILKSGVEIIRHPLNEILGSRVSNDIPKKIKDIASSFEGVLGVYDLILHDYGPNTYIGSLHIEIDEHMNALEIDKMSRHISAAVYEQTGVHIAAVGVYSQNADDSPAAQIRHNVRRIVMSHDGILEIHGFYINETEKQMTFDVIIDFSIQDRSTLYNHILTEIQHDYPDYHVNITLDADC